jgi:multiple sugar transport system substrate-binding protein
VGLWSCGPAIAEDIDFWARAANEAISSQLVEAWNATHEDKVKLTVFPDDQFVAKVAAAVGSGASPDILAVDLVYMPRFIADGVMRDVTAEVSALPYADELAPGHMAISTSADGRVFAVPRDVATSLLFWNKDLFAAAGLDPEAAPKNWAEIEDAARRISALGGDIKGFYFAGNCGGCNAYTAMPLIWASGGTVLDEAGAPTLDAPAVADTFAFYRKLWNEGLVPGGAQADNGANWLTGFIAGNVGIQPLGAFAIAPVRAGNPGLNFGVAPLPGKESGESSFSGGDVIGISAGSDSPDLAWQFIEWTLSEDVQVDVVAKNGSLVARNDLVDNKHAAADANLMAANAAMSVAQTPSSLAYNSIFNDPNGPWATAFASYVFEGNDNALADAQAAATQIFESEAQ